MSCSQNVLAPEDRGESCIQALLLRLCERMPDIAAAQKQERAWHTTPWVDRAMCLVWHGHTIHADHPWHYDVSTCARLSERHARQASILCKASALAICSLNLSLSRQTLSNRGLIKKLPAKPSAISLWCIPVTRSQAISSR